MPSSELLAAFAKNTPLHEIITAHKLTLEDLHAFLSSPGIPEQLEALRTLTNFSEDLQSSAGREEGTAYLRQFLKDEHEPVEKRRAATALLRGQARTTSRAPVNPDRKGGARCDISDWIASPPDEDIDDDLDTSDGTDCASNRVMPDPAPKPTRLSDAPQLPLTSTPDQLVSHQLSLIQSCTPPNPTSRDLLHAIDFHRLSFPIRANADLKQAFLAQVPSNLPNLQETDLTPDPATIHDTTPPTATVRVRIIRRAGPAPGSPDAQCLMPNTSALLFRLRFESTFPNDPTRPHAWHTTAITDSS